MPNVKTVKKLAQVMTTPNYLQTILVLNSINAKLTLSCFYFLHALSAVRASPIALLAKELLAKRAFSLSALFAM
jgi:hypothetical protein